MEIGVVVGNIVSTIKHKAYQSTKLLLVENVNMQLKQTGNTTVCVDSVDAGVGDIVLVAREGKAASEILGGEQLPVRSIIVGVVDNIQLDIPEK
jgi:microcompartment protein CcmK/EutM